MRDAYPALRFARVAQGQKLAVGTATGRSRVCAVNHDRGNSESREGRQFFGVPRQNFAGGKLLRAAMRARGMKKRRRGGTAAVDVDVMLANLLVFVLVRKMGLFRVELERAQCTRRSVRYSVTH
jgi:hypothetical protein